MQPILKYSKNNMCFFLNGSKKCTTAYLAYVINQWPNPFGPISNPPVFGVIYVIEYFGGFRYFIAHDIKNWFNNAATLVKKERGVLRQTHPDLML
jgi:hypothetical protein